MMKLGGWVGRRGVVAGAIVEVVDEFGKSFLALVIQVFLLVNRGVCRSDIRIGGLLLNASIVVSPG